MGKVEIVGVCSGFKSVTVTPVDHLEQPCSLKIGRFQEFTVIR